MNEYYVIRNKNTGSYFRGKGVNRWGKYLNQASIYRIKANAENTVKEVSWRGEQAEVVPVQIIEGCDDVAKVCRCEKCKHVHFNTVSKTYHCRRRDYYSEEVQATDFCSYGKKGNPNE